MAALKVASFQVRLGYYDALVKMFQEKPFGYGFGRFADVYNQVKTPGTEESQLPHSWIIGYLGQGGIFPALLVIVCLFIIVRIVSQSGASSLVKWTCGVAVFSWFFHSILDVNIMIPGSVMIFAVVAAMSLQNEESERNCSFRRAFYCLIPVACIFIYTGVKRMIGESYFSRIYATLSNPQEISTDRLRDLLKKMDRTMPYAGHGYKLVGGSALGIFEHANGLNDIQRSDYLNLAEECLLEVIERSPKNASAYYLLSQVYVNKMDSLAALKAIDEAVELRPDHRNFLALQKSVLYKLYRLDKNLYFVEILHNEMRRLRAGLGRLGFQKKLGNLAEEKVVQLTELQAKYRELKSVFVKFSDSTAMSELVDFHKELRALEAEFEASRTAIR